VLEEFLMYLYKCCSVYGKSLVNVVDFTWFCGKYGIFVFHQCFKS